MSADDKGEAFLDRWSRLKQQKLQEEARDEARDEAQPPPAVEAGQEPAPAAPLPAIEDLNSDSDFKAFMDPGVDAGTRRTALKKLFTNSHFSTIDPFEPYSIDLTGEDPIPEAMLKTLDHARRVLFDEEYEAAQAQARAEAQAQAEAQVKQQSSPQPQAENTEPQNVAGKQDA